MTGGDREGFAAFLLRMRGLGIDRRDLMTAFETTPRRNFVPAQWQADAWSSRMLPIECGEAIEGVDLQARVLSALDLQPGHKVLEIGTGSGYTAAVMSRLAARVQSLERYRTLVEMASQRLEALELSNVILRQADGRAGAAPRVPSTASWCGRLLRSILATSSTSFRRTASRSPRSAPPRTNRLWRGCPRSAAASNARTSRACACCLWPRAWRRQSEVFPGSWRQIGAISSRSLTAQ
jgi:hypothetical protein